MYLESVRLYKFRNLADQTVELCSGLNFFVGENGQGKTNFLEAASVLSSARSFRGSKSAELVRLGEKECSVFGSVRRRFGPEQNQSETIQLGLAVSDREKQAFLHGEPCLSLAEYIGNLICISFSPADLALVFGGPALRRSFLDKHCVDLNPKAIVSLANYQRALRSKNIILREALSTHEMNAALDSWDYILASNASEIMRIRKELIEALAPRVQQQYATLAHYGETQPREMVGIELVASLGSSEVAKEAIFETLRAHRSRDIAMGSAQRGPHRDELKITLAGKELKNFGSQGQVRSVVLALKLAMVELLHERRADEAVLLLDDVDSELDATRRQSLVQLILKLSAQAIVTGTRNWDEMQGAHEKRIFTVKMGEISRHEG
jgi:DNA replication and repair protein RecF